MAAHLPPRSVRTALVCLTVVLCTSFFLSSSSAETIYVDQGGGGNYTTIQDGIDNAAYNDTIMIAAGTYAESVVVNQTVSIIGASASTVIIDAGSSNGIVVEEPDVTVKFITVDGSDTGIEVDSDDCMIEGVAITDSNIGIDAASIDDLTVINTSITNSGDDGIYLYDVVNAVLSNITVRGSEKNGIFLELCELNDLADVFVRRNKMDGLFIKDSDNNTFTNVTAHWNGHSTLPTDEKNGFHLEKSDWNTITGSETAYHPNKNGLFLEYECYNNEIEGLVVINNSIGIMVEDSDLNSLSDLAISMNGSASSGIGLEGSTDNEISHADIDGAPIGINLVQNSDDNTLWNCSVTDASVGVTLEDTTDIEIFNSTVLGTKSFNVDSSDLTTFNCTFNDSDESDGGTLTVKNWLHIRVNETISKKGISNANVFVRDDTSSKTVYSTAFYGGTDPKTGSGGWVKWVLITSWTKDGGTPDYHTVYTAVEFGGWSEDRYVDMNTTHPEYFEYDVVVYDSELNITSDVVWTNMTVILRNNMTVMPNASLTMYNVKLYIDSHFINTSNLIRVLNDGWLRIFDADMNDSTTNDRTVLTLLNLSSGRPYRIILEPGSSAEIRNSELRRGGTSGANATENAALLVKTEDLVMGSVIFERCTWAVVISEVAFAGNLTGIYVADSGYGISIINSTDVSLLRPSFTNNTMDIRSINGSTLGIFDSVHSDSPDGVLTKGTGNITISGTVMSGMDRGISIGGTNGNSSIDSIIINTTGTGFIFKDSPGHGYGTINGSLTLSSGTFYDNGIGARFRCDAPGFEIFTDDNSFEDNDIGLLAENTSDARFVNDDFDLNYAPIGGNGRFDDGGMILDNSSEIDVVGTLLNTNVAGIAVKNTFNITLTSIDLTGLGTTDSVGIELSNVTGMYINVSDIDWNLYGIRVTDSSDLVVSETSIWDCEIGIDIDSSIVTVENDSWFGSSATGIDIGSDGVTVTESRFDGTDTGISLKGDGNNITGNEFASCSIAALFMEGGMNNLIEDNEVQGDTLGFVIDKGFSNSIESNTFSGLDTAIELRHKASENIVGSNQITKASSDLAFHLTGGGQYNRIRDDNTVNNETIYYYFEKSDIVLGWIAVQVENITNLGQINFVNCSNMRANYVTSSNGRIGINAVNTDILEITRCVLEDNVHGIVARNTTDVLVSNTRFESSMTGFLMDNITFTGQDEAESFFDQNTIIDNQIGGMMVNCKEAEISNTELGDNVIGLIIDGGEGNVLDSQTEIYNSTIGLWCIGDESTEVTQSYIHHNVDGVLFDGSTGPRITMSLLKGNDRTVVGIDCTDISIIQNQRIQHTIQPMFSDSGVAIDLEGCSGTVIEENEFQDGTWPINATDCDDILVTLNEFSGFDEGAYLLRVTDIMFEGNDMVSRADHIVMADCSDIDVVQNTFSNGERSVVVDGCYRGNIEANEMVDDRSAIEVIASEKIDVVLNDILVEKLDELGNPDFQMSGIKISDSINITASSNEISAVKYGIQVVDDSIDTEVEENTVSDCIFYGIFTGDSERTQVVSNTVHRGTTGLYSRSAKNATFTSNVVNGSMVGIRIEDSKWMLVSDSLIISSSETGILVDSFVTDLESNTIIGADIGIHILDSNRIGSTDNVVNLTDIGIRIEDSTDVTDRDGLYHESDTGVVIDNSSAQMNDSMVKDNAMLGVSIIDAKDAHLSDMTIRDCGLEGMRITDSKRIILTNVVIDGEMEVGLEVIDSGIAGRSMTFRNVSIGIDAMTSDLFIEGTIIEVPEAGITTTGSSVELVTSDISSDGTGWTSKGDNIIMNLCRFLGPGEAARISGSDIDSMENTTYDEVVVMNECGKVTAINVSFSDLDLLNGTEVEVMNYLTIKVISPATFNPIRDADVRVWNDDDNPVYYATEEYGGSDNRTDHQGMIGPLLITDKIYRDDEVTDPMTAIKVYFNLWEIEDLNVDMSNSHKEIYYYEVDISAYIEIVSGDGQKGMGELQLKKPLVVRVTDHNGDPQDGYMVNFTSEGGRFNSTSVRTNASGVASVRFTPDQPEVDDLPYVYVTAGILTEPAKNVTFNISVKRLEVDLVVPSGNIYAGEVVTITVKTNGEGIMHNIDFGDGSSTGWINMTTVRHTYSTGTYKITVVSMDEKGATSATFNETIDVSRRPVDDKPRSVSEQVSSNFIWILILLIVIVILIVLIIKPDLIRKGKDEPAEKERRPKKKELEFEEFDDSLEEELFFDMEEKKKPAKKPRKPGKTIEKGKPVSKKGGKEKTLEDLVLELEEKKKGQPISTKKRKFFFEKEDE